MKNWNQQGIRCQPQSPQRSPTHIRSTHIKTTVVSNTEHSRRIRDISGFKPKLWTLQCCRKSPSIPSISLSSTFRISHFSFGPALFSLKFKAEVWRKNVSVERANTYQRKWWCGGYSENSWRGRATIYRWKPWVSLCRERRGMWRQCFWFIGRVIG